MQVVSPEMPTSAKSPCGAATGGGLSLPIWISFMEQVLKGVPVKAVTVPDGVINSGGEYFLEEFPRGGGVRSLGLDAVPAVVNQPNDQSGQPADERKQILDLFKN